MHSYGFRLIRYLRPPVDVCQGFDLVPLLFQPLAVCGEGQLEVRQRLEMTVLQRRVRQLPQALSRLQLWRFSTGQLALEGVPEGFKLSLSIWSLCDTDSG